MKQRAVSFSRRVTLFFRRPKVEKTVSILGSIVKYAFFAFVMMCLYLPIFLIAVQSFNKSSELTAFSGFTWQYWVNVLTFQVPSVKVEKAILTTLIVAVSATLLATLLGTIVAIGIHALTKKRRQSMVIINQIPILNADIITGLSLAMIFKIFVDAMPGVFSFGLGTLIFAHVFFCIPYVVLSVLPKLAELDENLYEAALDLGCKPAAAIGRVIVPAIAPGILSGMLIAFTMSIDDYLISLFNKGQRGIGAENLSIYVYNAANRTIEHEVYAFSSILSLTVFVVLIAVYVKSLLKQKHLLNGSKKPKI